MVKEIKRRLAASKQNLGSRNWVIVAKKQANLGTPSPKTNVALRDVSNVNREQKVICSNMNWSYAKTESLVSMDEVSKTACLGCKS